MFMYAPQYQVKFLVCVNLPGNRPVPDSSSQEKLPCTEGMYTNAGQFIVECRGEKILKKGGLDKVSSLKTRQSFRGMAQSN